MCYKEITGCYSGTIGFTGGFFSVLHKTITADPHSFKTMWSSVGLSVINVVWSSLALCFLVAFCAHKVSRLLPGIFDTCPAYVLFQDLIRYGKTKQSLKRDEWLRVFDVPKR